MRRKYLIIATIAVAVLLLASSLPAMRSTFIPEYQPVCHEESYNKITNQDKEKIMPSRVIEKVVRIEKQSLDELKKDNMEHVKFLRKNLGPEVAQKIIDSYFALRAEELEKLHEGEKTKIKLIEIGSNSPLLCHIRVILTEALKKQIL